MTVETAVFTCSICGEPSKEICVACTKDACENHRCLRCKRCSDCCECEAPLSAGEMDTEQPAAAEAPPAAGSIVGPPEPAVAPESPESPLMPDAVVPGTPPDGGPAGDGLDQDSSGSDEGPVEPTPR